MKKIKHFIAQVTGLIVIPFQGLFKKNDKEKKIDDDKGKEASKEQRKEDKKVSKEKTNSLKTSSLGQEPILKKNEPKKEQHEERNVAQTPVLIESVEEKKEEKEATKEEPKDFGDTSIERDSPKKKPNISFIPLIEFPDKKTKKTNLKESEVNQLESLSLQKKIEDGFDDMLSKRRETLNTLIMSYNKIYKAYQNTDDKEEIEQFITEINDILEQLTLLQKEMELLKEKGDIKAISDLEGVFIKDISRFNAFTPQVVQSYMEESEQYNKIVLKIVELDEKRDALEDCLQVKKEFLEERDQAFYEMTKEAGIASDFEEHLYKDCEMLDQIAKDLLEKAEKNIEITERIRYRFDLVNRATLLLLSALTLARSTRGPRSIPMTILVGMLAIHAGRELVQGNQEVELVRNYSDYTKEIENAMSSLEDAKELLKKGKKSIEALESDFLEQFHDELANHKEYQQVLFLIQNVKDSFDEKEDQLKEVSKTLDKSMKTTKEKVSQLEK